MVYMNHIFIIRSSTEGHLGCLHSLAIVMRATNENDLSVE